MDRNLYMTTGEFAALMGVSNIRYSIMMILACFLRNMWQRTVTVCIHFISWKLWKRF